MSQAFHEKKNPFLLINTRGQNHANSTPIEAPQHLGSDDNGYDNWSPVIL